MSTVWQTMASNSGQLGRVAYTKQKSAMYQKMEHNAKDTFSNAGYRSLVEHLINHPQGKILAGFVTAECLDPAYVIPEINPEVRQTKRPFIICTYTILCRIQVNNRPTDSMDYIGSSLVCWFNDRLMDHTVWMVWFSLNPSSDMCCSTFCLHLIGLAGLSDQLISLHVYSFSEDS
jgi:hypothetical protein